MKVQIKIHRTRPNYATDKTLNILCTTSPRNFHRQLQFFFILAFENRVKIMLIYVGTYKNILGR